MLAGKFLSCGGLLGSIMAGSGEQERLSRTRHYICSEPWTEEGLEASLIFAGTVQIGETFSMKM